MNLKLTWLTYRENKIIAVYVRSLMVEMIGKLLLLCKRRRVLQNNSI